MRIGVFGGSFNPIHKYHERIASYLTENGYIDKIIFVPTGSKYHYKNNLISDSKRLDMLKLVTKKHDTFEVSNYELQDHEIHTCETLKYLKELYNEDEIIFICGTDNLTYIDRWQDGLLLLENYKFLVVKRDTDEIEEILKRYKKYKSNIIVVDMETDSLSSTYIRNNIDKDEVREYLDEDVYEYIIKNNLYR